MRKLFLLGTMVAMLVLSAGCVSTTDAQSFFSNKQIVGSKNLVTKKIRVDKFTRLVVQGSCDVVYTQTSGKQLIEVYGSDNLVDLMDVKVDGNTLIVSHKRGYSFTIGKGAKLELRITAPMVESAVLNGSGDIEFKNGIDVSGNINICLNGSGDIEADRVKCNVLETAVNGSGDIELNHIKAASVSASVNGSGDLSLKGQCLAAELSVNGSGDLSASALEADEVRASVHGSGDVTCYAVEKLHAHTTGSGDIGYKGNPQISKQAKTDLYKIN